MSRYTEAILRRGPVAYWPLGDAGASGVAADATDHGYTAAIADTTGSFAVGSSPFPCGGRSTQFATAIEGQSCWLRSMGTLAEWPASRLPNEPAPFTYECWLHVVSGFPDAVRLVVDNGGAYFTYLIAFTGGGDSPYLVQTSAWRGSDVTRAWAPTIADRHAWQYVVGLWDGSIWQLYVNGERLTLTEDYGVPDGTFTPTEMSLGFFGSGIGVMEVAHAALYDRALDSEEIAAGYAAAGCDLLRFTHASGGTTARWTAPEGRTVRVSYHG